MNRIVPTGVRLFLVIPIFFLALAAAAVAGNGKATVCERSAGDMHAACKAGVRDELHTTVANCRNLAGAAARHECLENAIRTRNDEIGACHEVLEARQAACNLLGENRYRDPLTDPAKLFIAPDAIPGTYPPNPYVSLAAGHTYVLNAGEDGILRDIEGSFEAGRDFARAGELIRAFPAALESHRQEYSLGEAEDVVRYVATMTAPADDEGGDNEAFPCSPDLCLKTVEFSPLEPESAEFKYYLPGTGFVLAVAMEDGEVTGEREELVCVGDSLDVLEDPACGIDNPQALLDAVCTLSGVFCD